MYKELKWLLLLAFLASPVVADATTDAFFTTPGAPSCSDGTPPGDCSTTKPYWCEPGSLALVSNASVCGCPPGEVQSGDDCVTAQTGVGGENHYGFVAMGVGSSLMLLLVSWRRKSPFFYAITGALLILSCFSILGVGVDVPSGAFNLENTTNQNFTETWFSNTSYENGSVIGMSTENRTVMKPVTMLVITTSEFTRYSANWLELFGLILLLAGIACYGVSVQGFLEYGRRTKPTQDELEES